MTQVPTEKDVAPIIVPDYQSPVDKSNNNIINKIKRFINNKQIKPKKKEKKQKVLSQTPSVLPFISIERDWIVLKDGVMDILQITSKDLNSLNEEETAMMIHFHSVLYKSYYPSIKEVSLNFPANTSKQTQYWLKKKERTTDPLRLKFIERKLFELSYLEKERTNREFYLFIFADNEHQLEERRRQVRKSSQRSFPLVPISNEKKIDILYLLNNQNSKL